MLKRFQSEVFLICYDGVMRHLVIPTVNVFVIKGSRLMLGRRFNTGWMDGYLCPFGGHIEAGETPIVALLREIKEELGVVVKPEELEFVCVAARSTLAGETVAYEFVIRDKQYEFKNNEPEKCRELTWVELDALPEDIIDHFQQIITRGIIGKEKYIEIGY